MKKRLCLALVLGLIASASYATIQLWEGGVLTETHEYLGLFLGAFLSTAALSQAHLQRVLSCLFRALIVFFAAWTGLGIATAVRDLLTGHAGRLVLYHPGSYILFTIYVGWWLIPLFALLLWISSRVPPPTGETTRMAAAPEDPGVRTVRVKHGPPGPRPAARR